MAHQPATAPKYVNRLANQSSPYLLQHAHNPVDWYPWGPEAFARARAEDKPIFLSVGYSTCYWCHVMERQSFESEQIAAEMNRRFVNIKVDREERPDVDQLYMTAVQVLTRHGGWPMSVFLTPDLKPFYGGTYFPPTDQHGRPGFLTVLRAIDDAYHNRKQDVEQTTSQLLNILHQLAEPQAPQGPITIGFDFIDNLIERSTADHDPQYGGFGAAPKFPRQTLLELLLAYLDTSSNDPSARLDNETADRKGRVTQMLRHTLDALARGGIRDHLGGGFHRYSTDAGWLVPHFEIMLYDNAMLGWVYVEAYRQLEVRRYAKVARGIFDFVLREMTSPQGAFYTAFDAEVDAREGQSYLWSKEEVESLLGPQDAKLFNHVYGVDLGPNFADPHHGSGTPDRSILYLPRPLEAVAEEMKIDAEELEVRLARMRQALYEARRQRKQPLLDRKIITSWNALMIRALARGGELLAEQRYLDAAARAADFLLRHHRTGDGGLIRTSGGGREDVAEQPAVGGTEEFVASSAEPRERIIEPPDVEVVVSEPAPVRETVTPEDQSERIPAFLDDYAFLIQALIALRNGSGSEKWKEHAAALAITMLDRFADRDRGGFYFTEAAARDLIVRQKIATDSPLPSGNGVAALAMLELNQPEETRRTLEVFARQMHTSGEGMSAMVQAALQYLRRHGTISVEAAAEAGEADRPLSPEQVAAGVVSMRAAWRDSMTLAVHVNILKGFHINAREPGEGMIGTQLTVAGPQAGDVRVIDYPPGEEQRFAFAGRPLKVYSGEVVFAVRFRKRMTDEGKVRLALSCQACDDNACLPPVTKQIEVNTP